MFGYPADSTVAIQPKIGRRPIRPVKQIRQDSLLIETPILLRPLRGWTILPVTWLEIHDFEKLRTITALGELIL